jgi:hypothetical protein
MIIRGLTWKHLHKSDPKASLFITKSYQSHEYTLHRIRAHFLKINSSQFNNAAYNFHTFL